MKICFYSNRIQFDGDWLEKRGLGGSESSLINLTYTWKKKYPNDNIIIYNGIFPREKTNYDGIEYRTFNDFMSEYKNFNADVFISLRDDFPFKLDYIDSKIKCIWSQDDMNEQGMKNLSVNKYYSENIDIMFVLSEHSYNDIKKSFPNKEIHIIRNGYRDDWVPKNKIITDEICPIAVYTSTPFRGLDVLSDMWNEIYEKCTKNNFYPVLKIFGGMSLYGRSENDFEPLYNKLRSQNGVKFIGSISQKELYNQLSYSKVMLYPNHFLETDCISVTEALACQNWVVTTKLGALPEKVKHEKNGFLIEGNSRDNEYQKKFIEYSVQALCNNYVQNSKNLIFPWKKQVLKMRNIIIKKLKGQI